MIGMLFHCSWIDESDADGTSVTQSLGCVACFIFRRFSNRFFDELLIFGR